MDITLEESELLQELVNRFDYPPFDPKKHVTAGMLAEQLGKTCSITQKATRNKLEKLYNAGELLKERVRLDNGLWAWGYYKK